MKSIIKIFILYFFFVLLISNLSLVYGAEEIEIKLTPNKTDLTNSDVMLLIDISSTKIFDATSYQAVQIINGEPSSSNEWADLEVGQNGMPLKKPYNYIAKQNGKVSVRVVSWTKSDRSDLKELCVKSYQVSNIDKNNPVIEKIDYSISNNTATFNVLAKDSESGISKYSCICEAISYNQVLDNSKFVVSGLEIDKEYVFFITVEDKIGNKTTQTKKVKISSTEPQTVTQNQNNTLNQNTQLTNQTTENADNTISKKVLPNVGEKNILIGIVVFFIISFIYIFNKR